MLWRLLKEDLQRIGSIGRTESGGITRLPFTPEYDRAALALMHAMEQAGLQVRRDCVDNIHGVLPSPNPHAKTLYIGSHLDTVREGGLYDGALGVLAGLACARELVQQGRPLPFHLHLLATNGEEGSDLGGTFGSRCMMGLVDPDQPGYLNIAQKYGITREKICAARLDTADSLGYLELHIEQGQTLDKTGDDLGVVTGIVGLRRWTVTALGEANHAGTTRMAFRRDAMVTSAKLITEIDAIARASDHDLVATVGTFALYPNSPPVIPGRAEFVLETRSQDTGEMDRFFAAVQAAAKQIPDADFAFVPLVEKAPVRCDAALRDVLSKSCAASGLAWREMPSGATHDANAFALKMPIGMLFVPSRGGISHSREEYTDWEHIRRGADVLYASLLALRDSMQEKE